MVELIRYFALHKTPVCRSFGDMEVGLWEIIGGGLATFATAAATWVFSRKQSQAEIGKLQQEIQTIAAERERDMKSSEVEIMERYRQLYNALVEDITRQMDQLKKDNEKYREQIRKLEKNDNDLRRELNDLKREFPCIDCPRRTKTSKSNEN